MRAPQQQRGRERRAAVVRAAAEIAAEAGFAAVSHRSVAQRAGVPLGSTTYYFSSLDELLGAVAGAMVDECLDRGSAVVSAAQPGTYSPKEAAALVTEAVLPGDERILGYYEPLLSAARHPAVASALGQARPRLMAMVSRALDTTGYAGRVSADLVLAVVDGAALSALSEGRPDVRVFVTDVTAELFGSTLTAQPTS